MRKIHTCQACMGRVPAQRVRVLGKDALCVSCERTRNSLRKAIQEARFGVFREELYSSYEEDREENPEYNRNVGAVMALEGFAVKNGIFSTRDLMGFYAEDEEKFRNTLTVYTVSYCGEVEYFLKEAAAKYAVKVNARIGANPILGSVKYKDIDAEEIDFRDYCY